MSSALRYAPVIAPKTNSTDLQRPGISAFAIRLTTLLTSSGQILSLNHPNSNRRSKKIN